MSGRDGEETNLTDISYTATLFVTWCTMECGVWCTQYSPVLQYFSTNS